MTQENDVKYPALTTDQVLTRLQDAINYIRIEKAKPTTTGPEAQALGFYLRGLIQAKQMLKERTA